MAFLVGSYCLSSRPWTPGAMSCDCGCGLRLDFVSSDGPLAPHKISVFLFPDIRLRTLSLHPSKPCTRHHWGVRGTRHASSNSKNDIGNLKYDEAAISVLGSCSVCPRTKQAAEGDPNIRLRHGRVKTGRLKGEQSIEEKTKDMKECLPNVMHHALGVIKTSVFGNSREMV